mgnify:CR=1 FL=1
MKLIKKVRTNLPNQNGISKLWINKFFVHKLYLLKIDCCAHKWTCKVEGVLRYNLCKFLFKRKANFYRILARWISSSFDSRKKALAVLLQNSERNCGGTSINMFQISNFYLIVWQTIRNVLRIFLHLTPFPKSQISVYGTWKNSEPTPCYI